MKITSKLLAIALVAGGSMFAAPRLSIGISVGGHAQSYVPPCPGPGYTWVDGYWSPQSGRNVWTAGFWRAPQVRVAPRFVQPPRDYDRAFIHRDDRRNDDHRNDNHRNDNHRNDDRNDDHRDSRNFRR